MIISLAHKLFFFNPSLNWNTAYSSGRCFLSSLISWGRKKPIIVQIKKKCSVVGAYEASEADLPRSRGKEGGESRRKEQWIPTRLYLMNNTVLQTR